MKYKVTNVFATDTKKDGTKMINKWGKPTWRVGIKVAEHGDTWINGFLPFNPDRWEGTEQELIISEEEYNGEKRMKFETPKKAAGGLTDQDREQLARIEKYVTNINNYVVEIIRQMKGGMPVYPTPEVEGLKEVDGKLVQPFEEEINPEDIPF